MVGFGSGSPPAGRPGKRPETRAENWFARHASGPETGPWGRPPRVGQLHPILIVQCYSKTLSPSVSESSSLNWPRSIGGAFFFRSRRAPLLVRRQEGATNWIPSQSPVQDRAERMSIPTPPDGLSMTGPFRYFTVCSKTRGAGPLALPATHISVLSWVAGRARGPEQTQKMRGRAFSNRLRYARDQGLLLKSEFAALVLRPSAGECLWRGANERWPPCPG